ncbi:hypothetical protein V8C37DRAFT_412477 [Trichoderma ceciliae]
MASSTNSHPETSVDNRKEPLRRDRLLTPEPTPAVEDGRVAADLARQAAQTSEPAKTPPSIVVEDHASEDPKQEIQRVLKCNKDSSEEILAVKGDASEEDKLIAWRRLEIRNAALALGVDQTFIDQVMLWDGWEDLEVDDETSSVAPSHESMDEDAIPTLPERLKEFNNRIVAGNQAANSKAEKESERIPDEQWTIPLGFFGPHYRLVQQDYAILQSDPTNREDRRRILTEKEIIDQHVQKYHFPGEWGVLEPDAYLASRAAKPAVGKPAASVADTKRDHMEYPWLTARAADGSLIVGVRRQGREGTQVCVEALEDGGLIRRLESASNVGLLEVERYMETKDHKNLAEGQAKWSSSDRKDFEKLLWVTKSKMQRKNIAAGGKDPPADCCVQFRSQGIQILTVTSLTKVLGKASARAQIKNDPRRRRAMKDAQARASSSGRGGRTRRNSSVSSRTSTSDDNRIDKLESAMAEMSKTMNSMSRMFHDLMKASATTSTPSI